MQVNLLHNAYFLKSTKLQTCVCTLNMTCVHLRLALSRIWHVTWVKRNEQSSMDFYTLDLHVGCWSAISSCFSLSFPWLAIRESQVWSLRWRKQRMVVWFADFVAMHATTNGPWTQIDCAASQARVAVRRWGLLSRKSRGGAWSLFILLIMNPNLFSSFYPLTWSWTIKSR